MTYDSGKKVLLLIRRLDGAEYNVVVEHFCARGHRLSLTLRNKLRFFEQIVCGDIICIRVDDKMTLTRMTPTTRPRAQLNTQVQFQASKVRVSIQLKLKQH